MQRTLCYKINLMKRLITLIAVAIVSVSWGQNTSDKKVPEFIVHMADARIMDREEGRLAASLGTTQAIRDYGTQMVKDQDMLLAKLQTLAASKNITLPNAISEKKSKQLEKLSKLTGKPFDRKFLKMIKADHKRDIKRFKKATFFEDGDTRVFAETNLKLIEQQLAQAQALAKR